MPSGPLARGRPDTDTARWRGRMAQLLKQVTSDDDVLEVWEHVKEMAKGSDDIQWATLFLAYTMGKPAAPPDSSATIHVEGNLNAIQLTREQLDALASLKAIDGTYTTVTPEPTPVLEPAHETA